MSRQFSRRSEHFPDLHMIENVHIIVVLASEELDLQTEFLRLMYADAHPMKRRNDNINNFLVIALIRLEEIFR